MEKERREGEGEKREERREKRMNENLPLFLTATFFLFPKKKTQHFKKKGFKKIKVVKKKLKNKIRIVN